MRLLFLCALCVLLAGALPAARGAAAAGGAVAIWKIYAPGWNLVAAPGGSRLALAGQTAYAVDPAGGDFQPAAQQRARAGDGYWVYYPQGAMLQLVGVPQPISSVHVAAGSWALLGNSGTAAAAVRGADIALSYTPDAGFAVAAWAQPGQAVLVYAYDDADVFLDPYAQPSVPATMTPRTQPPAQAPALPAAPGSSAATPSTELNYLYGLSPVLADVDQQLGDFADGLALADPANPTDPVWSALRVDIAQVQYDLAKLQTLAPPSRYARIHADIVTALTDIADGMNDTVIGLVQGQQDRLDLGAGLLQAGARRLDAAEQRLPQ